MLFKEPCQGVSAERLIIRDHLNDARQVGKHVTLVAVGQDGGHSSVVELDVEVVNLDEVYC